MVKQREELWILLKIRPSKKEKGKSKKEDMKVSILMNVIDRHKLTKKCVDRALACAGYKDWELLICDNGSKNKNIIRYIRNLKPAYFRENKQNEGNYQMLNQLLLRAKGDAFCVIGPDIWQPDNWLLSLVETYFAIPNSGIAGIHCVMQDGILKYVNGIKIMVTDGAIFGSAFWSREILNKVGYYCEDYGFYGLGDSDFGMRVQLAGYTNYYLHGMRSVHLGHDIKEGSEYRKMKWECLKKHKSILQANLSRYKETGKFYVGAPIKK